MCLRELLPNRCQLRSTRTQCGLEAALGARSCREFLGIAQQQGPGSSPLQGRRRAGEGSPWPRVWGSSVRRNQVSQGFVGSSSSPGEERHSRHRKQAGNKRKKVAQIPPAFNSLYASFLHIVPSSNQSSIICARSLEVCVAGIECLQITALLVLMKAYPG